MFEQIYKPVGRGLEVKLFAHAARAVLPQGGRPLGLIEHPPQRPGQRRNRNQRSRQNTRKAA